jgi:hypothetical protein
MSGVSRQILAGVEISNLKKGSRVTPPVDLNEKSQYSVHIKMCADAISDIRDALLRRICK